MLMFTRCYNKHSITEYLINSISIYQLLFCQDGFEQARTTPSCSKDLCNKTSVLLIYRSHTRLVCLHNILWHRGTYLELSEKKWCVFLVIKHNTGSGWW